ncbi:hypothetical protein SDC9_159461 [bioreactor metagenome]|uniref:Uncharacterized protein n=1 Tax=bioreactor metagenome TaxID=1076179 RepID=A0A645FFM4_9ZZZZ
MAVIQEGQAGEPCAKERQQLVSHHRVGDENGVNLAGLDQISQKARVVRHFQQMGEDKNIRSIALKLVHPGVIPLQGRDACHFITARGQFGQQIQVKLVRASHGHPRQDH